MVAANNVQARSNGVDGRGQPLVTTGGGPLPLAMPTQPATLTATRVATKANRTFFIGVPLSFTPTRGTLSCFAAPLVARRSKWFTGSGDVGQFKRDCVFGDTGTRRGQQNLRSPPTAWEEGGGLLDHHELR